MAAIAIINTPATVTPTTEPFDPDKLLDWGEEEFLLEFVGGGDKSEAWCEDRGGRDGVDGCGGLVDGVGLGFVLLGGKLGGLGTGGSGPGNGGVMVCAGGETGEEEEPLEGDGTGKDLTGGGGKFSAKGGAPGWGGDGWTGEVGGERAAGGGGVKEVLCGEGGGEFKCDAGEDLGGSEDDGGEGTEGDTGDGEAEFEGGEGGDVLELGGGDGGDRGGGEEVEPEGDVGEGGEEEEESGGGGEFDVPGVEELEPLLGGGEKFEGGDWLLPAGVGGELGDSAEPDILLLFQIWSESIQSFLTFLSVLLILTTIYKILSSASLILSDQKRNKLLYKSWTQSNRFSQTAKNPKP